MKVIVYLVFFALGVLSLRKRWAYITFVVLGLLYFPVSVAFRLNPQPCELSLNSALATHSLGNYVAHHSVCAVLYYECGAISFGSLVGVWLGRSGSNYNGHPGGNRGGYHRQP